MLHLLGEILQRANLLGDNLSLCNSLSQAKNIYLTRFQIRIDIKVIAIDFVLQSISNSDRLLVRLIYEV